jgi:LysM repeat protein
MISSFHFRSSRLIALVALLAGLVSPLQLSAAAPTEILPLEEFSPSFLGIYRKVMLIEDDILKYAAKYNVDVQLAKAVCMYESGGNASLKSGAGANGYFQVMPRTFGYMKVKTNIEAGIKYLGQMVKQFGREDYALAAYNGGPGRVAKRRPMPLESLQYVIGVGNYRSVLQAYEPSVRVHAEQLAYVEIQSGEHWWDISRRLGVPVVQLRLHNPFLASRRLRAGYIAAYPQTPRENLFVVNNGETHFTTRIGDNYMKVAYTLGVDLESMRQVNGLWRLQWPLPGTKLTFPVDQDRVFSEFTARPGEDIVQFAARVKADPWTIVMDNALWTNQLEPDTLLRIQTGRRAQAKAVAKAAKPTSKPAFQLHRVRKGDTVGALARRYGTTIRAIQTANKLGRRSGIRVGQRLRIPS